jgi:alanyl-tRNA synthetase
VLANFDVNTHITSYKRAVEEGAMALFGEEYGDEVRVVSFGEENTLRDDAVSIELCGGTHVDSTAEIGSFRVASEGSVAAGVRRMEVVTGRYAEKLIEERFDTLTSLSQLLSTTVDELPRAVRQLQEQNSQLQREVAQMRQKMARDESSELLDRVVQVDGAAVLAVRVDAGDIDTMRQMTDWFRDKLGSSVVVVGSLINQKPMLVAAATDDLIQRGVHAGNLVRDAAKIIGGGGGGRPNMAQAGGSQADKLDDALSSVTEWVTAHLN